jgi:hypothetical protein
MRNVKVTLAVGIALIAAVGAVTLTRSPPRVARVGVPGGDAGSTTTLASTPSDITVCQAHEALPAGVTGIRLAIWAFYGAQVHVRVYSSDSQLLTEGRRGADWTSDSVTVPVKPLDHATPNVQLCFAIGPNSQPMLLLGARTQASETASASGGDTPTPAAAASEHEHLGGRVGVEYLAAGRRSWWSQVLSVSRRLGLGRSFSGTWIALLLAALMAAVGVLAIRLTLRELP